MLKKVLFALVAVIQGAALSASLSFALPVGPFPRETVSGHRGANNGFSWDFRYDIEFKSGLLLHTELQFTLTAGVTQAQLDAVKPAWERGIEDMWSRKINIVKDNTHVFPILFDVTYEGPTFHYNVNVIPGRTTSMLDWGITPSPGETNGLLAAHEFGHMIGNFDEYVSGATNPSGVVIDPTSLMGSTGIGIVTYARHYEDLRSWLASKDPKERFDLAPVPEPSSILLFASSLGFLGVGRAYLRRRRPGKNSG